MQYQALALASSGVQVDLVGHAGAPADRDVEQHPSIQIHRLPRPRPVRPGARRSTYVLAAAWRTVTESFRLVQLLTWSLPAPDIVLTQTPPAIPTLVVAWLAARVRGARFIIDWHNFGDRMLALRLGPDSSLVHLAGTFERTAARCADAHLVVSAAMQRILEDGWHVTPVHVLYDRPAARFRRLDLEERSAARRELLDLLGIAVSTNAAIVISPTSWTADEDFAVLFEALQRYDRQDPVGDLIVVLTGDGPRRRHYEARASALKLAHVTIRAIWLEADAYPRLLAAADLGVCLHRSASGVDLPMKVADCFGAGLPVCALDYGPCLREMIRPGSTGLLFEDAATLARQLGELFADARSATGLQALRRGVEAASAETWEEGWSREARPLLLSR
jgi:beta-1,4-mannosyltransferase